MSTGLVDAQGRPLAADPAGADLRTWAIALVCQDCGRPVHPLPTFQATAADMLTFLGNEGRVLPNGWRCGCLGGSPHRPVVTMALEATLASEDAPSSPDEPAAAAATPGSSTT